MERQDSILRIVRQEIRALCLLGLPLAFSGIAQFLPQQINLSFTGHLGQHELDTSGLSISVLVIGGLSVYYGLCYAVMAHYSHAFGRRDYAAMIAYFQKTLVLALYVFIVCSVFMINGEALMVLIGQDRLIASMTGTYLWILIPGALGRLYFHILTRYLECQNMAWPGLLVSCVTAALSLAFHALFVTTFQWGINGAAIALSLAFALMPVLLLIIMLIMKSQRPALTKWSYAWLMEWKPFFWAAIPSIIQLVTWWASSEIGTFLAGNLSVKELAAQTVLFQFQLFVAMVPSGFAGACCARAGHHLGAGAIRNAKISMFTSLLLHCIFGVVIAIVYVAFGRELTRIFTNEQEVIDEVMKSIGWLAVSDVIEALVYSVLGSLRAMHRHSYTMVLTMVCYYVIALPIMIWLMYFTPLRLTGFWIGLCIGAFLQASSFVLYLLYILWKGNYTDLLKTDPAGNETSETKHQESSPLLQMDEENLDRSASVSVTSMGNVLPRGSLPPIRDFDHKESIAASSSLKSQSKTYQTASLKSLIGDKLLGTAAVLLLLLGYILLAVFQDLYLPPIDELPSNFTSNYNSTAKIS